MAARKAATSPPMRGPSRPSARWASEIVSAAGLLWVRFGMGATRFTGHPGNPGTLHFPGLTAARKASPSPPMRGPRRPPARLPSQTKSHLWPARLKFPHVRGGPSLRGTMLQQFSCTECRRSLCMQCLPVRLTDDQGLWRSWPIRCLLRQLPARSWHQRRWHWRLADGGIPMPLGCLQHPCQVSNGTVLFMCMCCLD